MLTSKSELIGDLAKALSAAQAEIKAAMFDSKNPFLGNKYSSLGAVIEVIRPVLEKNGLSYSQLVTGEPGKFETTADFTQDVDPKDKNKTVVAERSRQVVHTAGSVGVTTILMHSSGEWIQSSIEMALTDEKGRSAAQGAGAMITYLRRYALAALFGVYADEDTDGNQPGGNQSGGNQSKRGANQSKPAAQAQAAKAAQDVELTIEQALVTLSPGGSEIGKLTDEQLSMLITTASDKATAVMRKAAQMVVDYRLTEIEKAAE